MSLLTTIRDAIVIDFETDPIMPRPEYPPMPKGVSVWWPGKKPVYYTGATVMYAQVEKAFKSGKPLLFHNAGFDVEVAVEKLGCTMPPIELIHDSMVMLFLHDPHAKDYQLKPSSERLLGWAPEERDEVEEWLMKHQPVEGIKLSRSKGAKWKNGLPTYVGAWICKAPVDLVEKYANGDVLRTRKLAEFCARKWSKKPHMVQAYRDEVEMLPVIWHMEQSGVPVNVSALKRDLKLYEGWLEKVDAWILKKLKRDINIDSKEELVEALIDAKLADAGLFAKTATGKLSAAKDSLEGAITDDQLKAMLRWRGAVGTCLKNHMRPWFEQARGADGKIYIHWNSTRRDSGSSTAGARTGRMSSSPNLQNVPKKFKQLFKEHGGDGAPRCPLKGLPPVPMMRVYIAAPRGYTLIDRDFSSQELRVLAYFEDGDIAEAFAENPELDLHQRVADDLKISRKKAKTVNFAIIYGVGQTHLAELLDVSVQEAKDIKRRYFEAYPSVKSLIADLKDLSKDGKPIVTWCGREYYCEPPIFKNGRLWDFSYKLLNYTIQGSSAGYTKASMREFYAAKDKNTIMLGSVHDEVLALCPTTIWKSEMKKLKEIMNKDRLEQVPMRSTGKYGRSFGTMKECA